MQTQVISLLPQGAAIAVSSTNTYTSNPYPLRGAMVYAIQAVWSGTPAGNFKLQGSCDAGSPSNWTDLTTTTAAGGAVGSKIWDGHGTQPTGISWVRVSYTNSSSTGSIDAINLVAKG